MVTPLDYARRVQAIAQTGLTYSTNPFDIERFEELRVISSRLMALGGGITVPALHDAFAAQLGYATPKIDVRGAVFDNDKILLVREKADHDRWTLPGGWADVGLGPVANVLKEIVEESGIEAQVTKLAFIEDHGSPINRSASPFHIWKHFFVCQAIGGAARPSLETSEVTYFTRDRLPSELSESRTTHQHLQRLFAHHDQPNKPTELL